jgi:hypothetical protein
MPAHRIGTERLLGYIEQHQGGLPARVKAENRLKEFWPIWSRPQELRTDVMERAAITECIERGGKQCYVTSCSE